MVLAIQQETGPNLTPLQCAKAHVTYGSTKYTRSGAREGEELK
jgi:hypothetical protein